jgi:hypothetical protein
MAGEQLGQAVIGVEKLAWLAEIRWGEINFFEPSVMIDGINSRLVAE